jgi:hypothetical protein
MTDAAEAAARRYLLAEDRYRERARFLELTGQDQLAKGMRALADRCNRAALNEARETRPVQ